MATNLAIDDRLLQEALRTGGLRTKKETVTKALKEFIDRRRQRKVLKAFGTFQFRSDWDHKQDRHGREPRR
ncbi:MAG: type II toxin-antitoxin system VapB family antitoxin [Nitrospira sp.]|nr:type II toxin-antitoxin system VapB family antitoxin [Nitrospira sp.]